MSDVVDAHEYQTRLKQALLTLKRLQTRLDTIEKARSEPVAIIGIGCRFPGAAHDPQSFWDLLHNGTDAIRETPSDRWDINAYYATDPDMSGKIASRYGGFLDSVDQFDATFFGIAPREAMSMDPQQRLLLEVAWEALEHAGQPPEQLAGSSTGVFVGISTSDYTELLHDAGYVDAYTSTGNAFSVAAGRLSYILGLQGPCLAIDTACSSSLVAVHLACQSLRNGECNLAIASGVNLLLAPGSSIRVSALRMLATDGRCKTFDAAADGYVRGEGCGVLILKRLSDALAQGDRILALIRGSAINQDGRSGGLTAPNGPAQQALLRQALANAGVEPAQVSYIEAHGTGTQLGDPVEVQAIGAVLHERRPKEHSLVIGAVKTNIGHLEAAAGIAGIIKVVLSLQHGHIPPNLHLNKLNPHITLQNIPAIIPTTLFPWPAGPEPRIAGVSSFGFSGTNAHVVLEEAPLAAEAPPPSLERPLHLLPLSAKSAPALRALAARYLERLAAPDAPALADLCASAATGRSHFPLRRALCAATLDQLHPQLQALAETIDDPPSGFRLGASRPKVAFLFTGQGAQYAGMGQQLYQTQPLVRETLDRCAALLAPHLDRPLLEVLFGSDASTLLGQTAYTQPALFALDYALARLWQSWGVQPSAVLGHSLGEYVAACIAGVLSLEDALVLVAQRGRLMQALPPDGAMAAVLADESIVARAIAPYPSEVSIAALNGPNETVIAGWQRRIEQVCAELTAAGWTTRPLRVSHAFHSPLVEPMLDGLAEAAAQVAHQPPQLTLIANRTGAPISELDAEYWRGQARAPVRFAAGVEWLRAQGYQVFVEVGPHPTLLGLVQQGVTEEQGLLGLVSLRRGQDEWRTLLGSLARWYEAGGVVDWAAFERPYPRRRVSLPTYPFQRQRFWVISRTERKPQLVLPHNLFADWLYEVVWQPRPYSTVQQPSMQQPGIWIVFADQSGIGHMLAHLLEQGGHTAIIVSPGETNAQLTSKHWQIDPDGISQVEWLLREILRRSQQPCRGIVYCWGLDAIASPTDTGSSLERAVERSCGKALDMIQALGRLEFTPTPRLWLITMEAQSVVAGDTLPGIAQAPLWGLGRAVALEHPDIWGGLIDLEPETIRDNVAAVFAEITAGGSAEQVAFRNKQRYVARLVQHKSENAATRPWILQPNGTYLITGGLGGLGVELARWMVAQGARHIVLLGRNVPTATANTIIQGMEQSGAQIVITRTDVAQREQLAEVLASIEQRMPPLRGIIHGAGVLDNGVLSQQNRERFARVMAPKVEGAWNLHTLTQNIPLDFFVLFSSAAALFGAIGQANYAAANAFLDALAHYRQAQQLQALSINWGPWAEVGMAATLSTEYQHRLTNQGFKLITPNQGIAVFEYLLQQSVAQLGVLPVNWATFLQQFPAQAMPTLLSDHGDLISVHDLLEPPRLKRTDVIDRLARTAPEQRYAQLVAHLQKEVAHILGFVPPKLPTPQQGFFDMGMDSLMAVELRNRLVAQLGCSLVSTITFECPNIASLARRLLDDILSPESTSLKPTPLHASEDKQGGVPIEIQQLSEADLAAVIENEISLLERSRTKSGNDRHS